MPGNMFTPGRIGVISRSGTLSYEVSINLANGGEVSEFNPDYAVTEDARERAMSTVQDIVDGAIQVDLP